MEQTTQIDEPTTVNQMVHLVSGICTEMTVDQIADILGKLEFMKSIIREAEVEFKARAIEYIQANGPFMIGSDKYFVGITKNVKCNDVKNASEAIIENSGGDMDALYCCMSTSALKHGAAKKYLPPDVWAQCFTVEEKPKLNVVGEPVPELQIVDTEFLK